MHVNHIGLWVRHLESMRHFYTTTFGGVASSRYNNAQTGFSSYFITFDNAVRLELMTYSGLQVEPTDDPVGWGHIAFTVGETPEDVDMMTGRLKQAGCIVIDPPRWTGDGYYESKILDPEGNVIEITCCARVD
jgi:lactoylglutathione lyase